MERTSRNNKNRYRRNRNVKKRRHLKCNKSYKEGFTVDKDYFVKGVSADRGVLAFEVENDFGAKTFINIGSNIYGEFELVLTYPEVYKKF